MLFRSKAGYARSHSTHHEAVVAPLVTCAEVRRAVQRQSITELVKARTGHLPSTFVPCRPEYHG